MNEEPYTKKLLNDYNLKKIDQKFRDTLETIAEAYGFHAYVCEHTGRFVVTNDSYFYWDSDYSKETFFDDLRAYFHRESK